MHKINKKGLIIGAILSSIIFTGCSNQNASNNKDTSSSSATKVEQNVNESNKNTNSTAKDNIDLLKVLNEAKEIEVKEKMVSIGAGYDVYADDIHVGEIKGKYVNLTGDVFELKDLNGNVVKSEKQIKRWNMKLNRMAEVYDKDKNVSGYIGEEKIKDMFSWGYKFHFYDKDKNEIGYTDQKVLSFTDTFKVYDVENNLDYVIEGEFVSLTSSYDIEVNDASNIKAEDVVFYTAIQNEITRADKKKSKSTSKKVSNVVNSAVATGVVNNVSNKTKTSNTTTTTNNKKTNKADNKKSTSTSKNTTTSTNNKLSLKKDNNTGSVNKTTSNKKSTTSKNSSIKKSPSSSSTKKSTTKTSSSSSKKRR